MSQGLIYLPVSLSRGNEESAESSEPFLSLRVHPHPKEWGSGLCSKNGDPSHVVLLTQAAQVLD
jgi:hypothetical protein